MGPMTTEPILLVEDDQQVRTALTMVLVNAGYEVIQAASVKTALMHLDVVDLAAVVLDLRLPNGHGREVVKALLDKRNDVPVVIMSAYHSDDKWPELVAAVLAKPMQPGELRAAVRSAIEKFSRPIKSIRESTRRLRDAADPN